MNTLKLLSIASLLLYYAATEARPEVALFIAFMALILINGTIILKYEKRNKNENPGV